MGWSYEKERTIQSTFEKVRVGTGAATFLLLSYKCGQGLAKYIYNNNLSEAQSGLDEIESHEALGHALYPVKQEATYTSDTGKEMTVEEYVPVPIDQLKTEKLQVIENIKEAGPQADTPDFAAGAITAFMGTAILYKQFHGLIDVFINYPLAAIIGNGAHYTMRGFKAAADFFKKETPDQGNNDGPASSSTSNARIRPV